MFRALSRLAVDGLVSFSRWPLNLVTYLGLVSALLALGLIAWVLLQAGPRGWASTIAVVLMMSAVQLLSLGIIGEYLTRIFLEVKGRPTFLIASIVDKDGTATPAPTMTSTQTSAAPVAAAVDAPAVESRSSSSR